MIVAPGGDVVTANIGHTKDSTLPFRSNASHPSNTAWVQILKPWREWHPCSLCKRSSSVLLLYRNATATKFKARCMACSLMIVIDESMPWSWLE